MHQVHHALGAAIRWMVSISISAIALAGPAPGPKPVIDPRQGDVWLSAFYVWNKAVPPVPGRLLRYEPLPDTLMLSNAARGLRILYTSTDGIEGATSVAVSGTVYFPKGSPPSGGWPIVGWAHGFVGISDVCAPSWRPRTKRDIDYLNAWLAEGFAIVATDYQGMGTPGGHAWGVPVMEAYGVIDSVRAARHAFRDLSSQVVLVGQSQGARAVLSASALAPAYARDFAFKATVATGVPGGPPHARMTTAPQIPVPARTGGGVHARLAVFSLFRLMALDRNFDPSRYVSDGAKPALAAARTGCLAEVDQANAKNGVTVENALRNTPEAAKRTAARHEVYPRPKFAHPVFIGVGLADTTTFPEGQYNVAAEACYEGSIVETRYYPGLDHSGAVNTSLADSLPFVRKALAASPISGTCSTLKPPPLAR
jgi:hypothetical protein